MDDTRFARYKSYVPVLLRIALGAVFIAHGWGKLADVASTAGFFGKVGIPLATFMAWVVAAVEFFGGIAVLIGLGTRLASTLIACVMIVAIFQVKFAQGFVGGWEFDLTLLLMAVSLIILGSGPISVRAALTGESTVNEGARI